MLNPTEPYYKKIQEKSAKIQKSQATHTVYTVQLQIGVGAKLLQALVLATVQVL